jgi:hypothetical protein
MVYGDGIWIDEDTKKLENLYTTVSGGWVAVPLPKIFEKDQPPA